MHNVNGQARVMLVESGRVGRESSGRACEHTTYPHHPSSQSNLPWYATP